MRMLVKRSAILLAGALSSLCACSGSGEPAGDSAPVAEVSYEVVEGWPKLPAGVEVGEAAGVAVDSHDHVFVFHRADRNFGNAEVIAKPTVLCIDGATGELVSQWGANLFVVPHGLAIDAQDNVWLTDVGLDAIFKFSHDGEQLMKLGRK